MKSLTLSWCVESCSNLSQHALSLTDTYIDTHTHIQHTLYTRIRMHARTHMQMVMRLKQQVQELRDELTMATGEERTDELSQEEIDR